MGIKKTRTRAQIIKEYKAAVKKNPKYGGHIVIDLLPEHLRDYAKEVLKKRKEQYRKTRVIGKLDKKVYLYKYYPWCYRDYKPTLVLQGWYSVKAAKEKYLQFYGPHALKYIKFIRGKDAVEKEFSIGKTLYINGMWVHVRNRVFAPKAIIYNRNKESYKAELKKEILKSKARTSPQKDEKMVKELQYKHYEYQYVPTLKPKERLRVQNVQQIKAERKKDLYEE